MSIERLMPDTKLTDLTVSDVIDLIGWALTYYQSAHGEDVAGFAQSDPRPVLPPLNEHWRSVQGQWWRAGNATDAEGARSDH